MTTLNLTNNSRIVLETRYLLPGESPEDLFRRVARAISEPEEPDVKEKWEETFYEMMVSCRFMPNSPTLFNAGSGQGTLSACFVIPLEDNMESIMKAASVSAMIQKFGGGIGYSFSKLRARESKISTTHGKACGSVAVLKMLSALSDMITQGGKRHGANMGILSIRHPEIMEFIHMKDDDKTAQNFNISVAITDDFMEAVDQDLEWPLMDRSRHAIDNGIELDPSDPNTYEVKARMPAKQIWQDLVNSAWKTGDPGLYFIDESNRTNPTPHLGNLDSTNPCGEVPLLGFEACNLGSINLAAYVSGDGFDYDGLSDITRKATRFLDNVVSSNTFPSEEVTEAVRATRKIGLGVMGWHDALVKLGIPYDDKRSLVLSAKVMNTINQVSRETSILLAEERGPYPACREDTPIRNATRTCIAPTGSISAIAGCSSGVEPIFAVAFVKNVLDGKQLKEVNPYFVQIAREKGFYSEDLMNHVAKTGSVQECSEVPDEIKSLFKTALEVDYNAHVLTQAAFQEHTDLAVSKTINMPNDASVDDVMNAYRLAFDTKCKGITIYRDGSKSLQVLEVQKDDPTGEQSDDDALTEKIRPSHMNGITERIRTGHGNAFITINFDSTGRPFEVFTTVGKAGGCDSAQTDAIARLVSMALRSGVEVANIVTMLKGITCCPAWDNGTLIRSVPDAIALALEKHALGTKTSNGHSSRLGMSQVSENEIKNLLVGTASVESTSHSNTDTPKGNGSIIASRSRCPDCNAPLAVQEMCLVCMSCGWNKCGG